MASASITKIKDQLAAMKGSNARNRLKRKGEQLTHTVVGGAAAFAMGRLEKSATQALPTIFGLDHKLLYGVAAHLIGTSSSGKFADMSSAAGDGLIASYGYSEVKGTSITGIMGHDGGDDEFEAV